MKFGYGKTRTTWYIISGVAVGLLLMAVHELVESLDIPYHNWLLLVFVPLFALGMALLAHRENALYNWGSRLDDARTRVNDLMLEATATRRRQPAFEDRILPTCWRKLDCDKEDCPVYGMEHARCWLIAGTFCRGEVQGQFARKLDNCRLCEVYKQATQDPVKEITENFYAMNYLLSEREEELEKAYEGSRQRSEKLAGLVGLSEAAMSSIHLSDLLKNLLESAASFAGADLGFVSLLDKSGERLIAKATYGIEPRDSAGLFCRVGEGIIGQAFAGGYITVSEDIATDSRVTGDAIREMGVRTLISIPLQCREQTLGMMTLATLPSHYYTEEEKNTLCVAADRIAAAVENSRLVSELDRDREQAELVSELVDDMDARSGMASIYGSFVKLADRIIDFDRASLAIWQEESSKFEIVAMDTSAHRSWLRTGMLIPRDAMPFGQVMEQRRYLIRDDIKGDEFPADKLLVEEGIHSSAIFPLIFKGEALGTLNLGSFTPGSFSSDDAEMLQPLTRQLGLMLDSARLLQEARSTSLIDKPSGLYNHRHFYEVTVREVARSKRHKYPLSVLILGLHGFQQYSEHHPDADVEALVKRLAERLKRSVREIDIVARYGGDEFAVLLPEMEAEGGGGEFEDTLQVVGRLQQAIALVAAEVTEGGLSGETCVGMAEYPRHADNAAELLERADWALREARSGAKKVVFAVRSGQPRA